MKQIKGILLFLMSIVLVAFGSQNSKSSKNLVKRLEDETKKVGNKIKENELQAQAKKEEKTKQTVQKKQTVIVNSTQPQQSTQNVNVQPQPDAQPQQPEAATKQATFATVVENNSLNGKTGNKKNKRNNKNNNLNLNAKNELYKAPKHNRLKNKSSFVANDRPSKATKSRDSVSKSTSSNSTSGSSSSGGASSGGDSSSSE